MRYFASLLLCLGVVFISQSTAHFLLNYPTTIGFDDSLEGNAPCGSFSVDFSTDTVTDFHVGGDSLAMTSIHPQATWLFRATLDQTASGNWTTLLPAIVQTGLGDYCERDIIIPATWAGFKGVIGVVQDAPDGILYQCAAVNFVTGSIEPPSVCTNVTGLSAAYTTDAALSSLPATATSTSSATSTQAITTGGTSSTSTSTAKPSAATAIHSYGGFSLIMWVVMTAVATIMACLL